MTRDEAQAALDAADLIFDRETVDKAIDQLSLRLDVELYDQNPVVLCVMLGGLVITSDLIQRLRFPLELDYVHATRYQGGTVGGELGFSYCPERDFTGRTVLLLDDILDRGRTLEAVMQWLESRGAGRVLTAVLLDKKIGEARPVECDHSALEVPDRYVFGRGMDYHGYWRNLDAIYAVKE